MSAEQILVVDDGKENREFVVQYVLKPNDYRALVAKDGQEGLEMALKYRPDPRPSGSSRSSRHT